MISICAALAFLFFVLQQTHVVIDNLPRRGFWDYASTVLTFALVLIGGVTFIAVWYQSIETAKSAKAASDSVKEMQKQAVILQRQAEATENSVIAASKSVQAMQQQAAILERQTKATEVAADAAKNGATAAQQSADMAIATVKQMRGSARRELRARVAVVSAKRIGLAKAGSYQAEVTIRNFGKVTAYRCKCKVALILGTNNDSVFPEPRIVGDEPNVALPPGGEFTMVRYLESGTFESQQHSQVLASSHAVYVYGRVTYRDGFQSGRYTDFRLKSCGMDYSLNRFSFSGDGNTAG